MATATSFVLPGERQMRLAVWLREPGEAAFGRDLAVESRDAVAVCAASLVAAADEVVADYLASIASWPLRVRAVELARELAERVSTDQAAG